MDKNLLKEIQKVIENSKEITLTPREIKILEYRFGIDDGITHTLEETGKIFGVTRERIRQIEAKAIDKIKAKVELNKTN